MISLPKFVSLDTSTLVPLCKDYWSSTNSDRERARRFIGTMTDAGLYLTFTFTQVIELLRHPDDDVVSDRLGCLRSLPMIAWLRPYADTWFPGRAADLIQRELHAYYYDNARDWSEIVASTRTRVFETGTGSEMFVDNPELWEGWRDEARRQQYNEALIASIKRTDPGNITSEKLRDLRKLPIRDKRERREFMAQFARAMHWQLERHGDERLSNKRAVAESFSVDTLTRIDRFDDSMDDWEQAILHSCGVPSELVTPNTTIGDVGDLAVHVRQLKILGGHLRPPAELSILQVPIDTLPSQVLERRLSQLQCGADRVSGSDLGDGHLLPLAFYCSAIEVDKRTLEFVSQIRRGDNRFRGLLSPAVRSGDYTATVRRLNELGVL